MNDQDKIDFLWLRVLVGEEETRRRLKAGHYRSKRWKERRPVMLRWLERQPWRRAARPRSSEAPLGPESRGGVRRAFAPGAEPLDRVRWFLSDSSQPSI